MPRAETAITHVEYETESLMPDGPARILRVFSSKMAALESAVENRNGYLGLRYGETIEEGLARKAASVPPVKVTRAHAAGGVSVVEAAKNLKAANDKVSGGRTDD